MIKKLETLYKRNKDGSIQEWTISSTTSEGTPTAFIDKFSGKLNGKLIHHTEEVKEGTNIGKKNERDVSAQAEFQAQSDWTKQHDKGYKSLAELDIIEVSNDDVAVLLGYIPGQKQYMSKHDIDDEVIVIDNLQTTLGRVLPMFNTDASGNKKPMKCQPIDKAYIGKVDAKGNSLCKITSNAWCQRKLDGVRCLIFHDGIKWRAISSSGKSYDVAMRYILEEFENSNVDKDLVYDGEIYIHGLDLQMVSGWARKETPIPQHDKLQYHVFDVAIEDKCFHQRASLLSVEYLNNKDILTRVRFVYSDSLEQPNLEDVKRIHDKFVSEGYEGLIIRNGDGMYLFGGRSSEIFKMKDFHDDEFTITGARLGSRGHEDMVFELVTASGSPFSAKPVGDRSVKEAYWNDLDNIIGKVGTVTYLTLSQDGIPIGNTVFKCIRDYEN